MKSSYSSESTSVSSELSDDKASGAEDAFEKLYSVIETRLQEKKYEALVSMVDELFTLAKKIDNQLGEAYIDDVLYCDRALSLKVSVLEALANQSIDLKNYLRAADLYSKLLWVKPLNIEYYTGRFNAYTKLNKKDEASADITAIRALKIKIPDFISLNIPDKLSEYLLTRYDKTALDTLLQNPKESLDVFISASDHFERVKFELYQRSESIEEVSQIILYLEYKIALTNGLNKRFDLAYDEFSLAFESASKLKDTMMMSVCAINLVIAGFNLFDTDHIELSIKTINELVNSKPYAAMFKKMPTIYHGTIYELSKRFFSYFPILRHSRMQMSAEMCVDAAVEILTYSPDFVDGLNHYYSTLGEQYAHDKCHEKAILVYTKSLEMLQKCEPTEQQRTTTGSHYFLRAWNFEQVDLYDNAMEDYLSAAKYNNTKIDALKNINRLIENESMMSKTIEKELKKEAALKTAGALKAEKKELASNTMPDAKHAAKPLVDTGLVKADKSETITLDSQNLREFETQYSLVETRLQEKKYDALEIRISELFALAIKLDSHLCDSDTDDKHYFKRVSQLHASVLSALAKQAAGQNEYAKCVDLYTQIIQFKPFTSEYYAERFEASRKLNQDKVSGDDIAIIRILKKPLPDFLGTNRPDKLTSYLLSCYSKAELDGLLKNSKGLDVYKKAYQVFYNSDSLEEAYIELSIGLHSALDNQFDVASSYFYEAFETAVQINDPLMMGMCAINHAINSFYSGDLDYITLSSELISKLVNIPSYVTMMKTMPDNSPFSKNYLNTIDKLSERFNSYFYVLKNIPGMIQYLDRFVDTAIEIVKWTPMHLAKLNDYPEALGRYYATHSMTDKAIAVYTKSLNILEQFGESEFRNGVIVCHLLNRATRFEEMNLFDEALDDYMAVVKYNRKDQVAANCINRLIKQKSLASELIETKSKKSAPALEKNVLPEKHEAAASAMPVTPEVPTVSQSTATDVGEAKDARKPGVDKEAIKAIKLNKIALRKERIAKANQAKLTEINAHVNKSSRFESEVEKKLQQVDQLFQSLIDETSKETRVSLEADSIKQQRDVASDAFKRIHQQVEQINQLATKAKTTIDSVNYSLTESKKALNGIEKESIAIDEIIDKMTNLIEKEKAAFEQRLATYVLDQERLAEEKHNQYQKRLIKSTFTKRDFEQLVKLNDALKQIGLTLSIHGGAVIKYAMFLFAKTQEDKNRIRSIQLNDIDLVVESKSINDPALTKLLLSDPFRFKSANEKSNPYFSNFKVTHDHIFDLTVRDSTCYQSHNPIRLTRAFLTFSGSQLVLHDSNNELQKGINERQFDIDLPDPADPFIKSFFTLLLKNRHKFELYGFKLGKNTEIALYNPDWQVHYFKAKFSHSGKQEVTSNHPCIAEIADIIKKGYLPSYHARHMIISFIEAFCDYAYSIRDLTFANMIYKSMVAFYQSYEGHFESLDSSLIKMSILSLIQMQVFPKDRHIGSVHEQLLMSISEAIKEKNRALDVSSESSVQGLPSKQGLFKQPQQVVASISAGRLPSRYVPPG